MKRKLPVTTEYIRKHVPKETLGKFAMACHISRSNLYLYYDGLAIPRHETLQKIVNFLGKPITIMLTPEGKK